MEWGWITSFKVVEIDFFLVLLFGFGFIHKGVIEFDIARTSAKLTRRDDRTLLGNTFRTKTYSLALFVFILGIVFILRAWPEYQENRMTVLSIRAVAMVAFLWNQYWCYRMRRVLRDRLMLTLYGETYEAEERLV